MKTNQILKQAAFATLMFAIALTGCKKDEEQKDQTVDTNSLQQLAKDDNDIVNATDDVMNDANDVLSNNLNKSTDGLPCNVTVDSSTIENDSIIYNLTFNGLNCNGTRNRVGQVKVKKHVTTKWKDAGATVSVEFINLKITKVATGKSLTLNGKKIFKNVSGGLVKNLGNGTSSVVHTAIGSLQATFDDNSTRTWNVARQRTYTGTATNIILTLDGLGNADGYDKLVTWGTNRNGEKFYTQINQSIVVKQACGWDPCSGTKTHTIPDDSKTALIQFGYDNNNQPVTNNNCPSRYRIDWTKGNKSGTIYLPL